MTGKRMTASELKCLHERHNPDSYFFTRKTMKFFGDTMANYGCRKHKGYYELTRRQPVKHGINKSAFFDAETFKRLFESQLEAYK